MSATFLKALTQDVKCTVCGKQRILVVYSKMGKKTNPGEEGGGGRYKLTQTLES